MDLNKENKYDRQMRLWGEEGQLKLSTSKVLLIGADPSGVESIKNLVLAGISQIAIIDNKNQSQRDLNQFFINQHTYDESKLRGPEILSNILELNQTDVQGQFYTQYTKDLINQFDVIIINELEYHDCIQISDICEKSQKKSIYIHSNGMIGSVQVQTNVQYCNLLIQDFEKKEQETLKELRIREPYPELEDYFNSFKLDKLIQNASDDSAQKLVEIPYPVFLYKCGREWLRDNNNMIPGFKKQANDKYEIDNYKQKIREISFLYSDDLKQGFLNIDQAVQKYDQSFVLSQMIPDNVIQVFNSVYCINADQNSEAFWAMANVLQQFYKEFGRLPQTNYVPDMEASTQNYLKLKNIYISQHQKDFEWFKLKMLKFGPYDEKMTLYFINNARKISFIEQKPYRKQLDNIFNYNLKEQVLSEEDKENLLWLQALYGKNKFCSTCNYSIRQKKFGLQRYSRIQILFKGYYKIKLRIQFKNYIRNVIFQFRLLDAKIATTAAIIGGICAQETIKLLTNQFKPIDNCFIYNGIHGTGSSYQF